MNKTITIGQFILSLMAFLGGVVGWAVSVETRLATHKVQIQQILEMKQQINEIHDKVIRHEERLYNKSNYIVNTLDSTNYKNFNNGTNIN